MKPYIWSHSRIQLFNTCPAQYHFKYIAQEKQTFTGIEAFMGICVHSALEFLYKGIVQEKIHPVEDVLKVYQSEWTSRWNAAEEKGMPVKVIRHGISVNTYKNKGEVFLRDYYLAFYPFNQSKTIATEEKFIFRLLDKWEFIAFLDRIGTTGDGHYEIHDYKTGAKPMSANAALKDQQMDVYLLALSKDIRFEDLKDVKCYWYFLATGKGLVLKKHGGKVEAIEQDLAHKIEIIESAKDFPTKRSPLCSWCGWRELCPAFRAAPDKVME